MMLARKKDYLDGPARGAFRAYVDRRMALPDLANASNIRNAIARTRLRSTTRI